MTAGDTDVQLTNPNSIPCARFDGVDDNIVAKALPLFIGEPLTVSVWIKIRADVGGSIVNNTIDSTNRWGFGYRVTSARLEAAFNNGSAYSRDVKSTDNSILPNIWYHALYTTTGVDGTEKIYINGVDSSNGAGNNGHNAAVTLRINAVTDGSAAVLPSQITNLRFYNRALSTTEITRLARDEDIREGLIAHWNLNGNATESVAGNNGTVTGATFINDAYAIAVAVAAQRATYGISNLSGSYMCGNAMNGGQILHVATSLV